MAISVKNLTKNYGTTQAVKDISFEVGTGEVVGFLGPNGAGKTTTMKILTCFMPPTSGKVEIDGLDIEENSLEVRRKIGYLPELNPLYTDMNVLDYLEFAARLHGMEKDAIISRLKEIVNICGLTNVRHKDISELSKGFRQRVGLAQALIHDPDVLILDEPTSGLDPNQIIEIRNLIKKIGLAKTVILSTHILSEVQATCDRVIIINEGKIVADSTTEKLKEDFRVSEVITLELKAEAADPLNDVLPALKEIANCDSVEFAGSDEDVHKFSLRSDKGVDLRGEIFNSAVRNNWQILEMNRKTTSLEEVFLKLTSSKN